MRERERESERERERERERETVVCIGKQSVACVKPCQDLHCQEETLVRGRLNTKQALRIQGTGSR